MMEVVVLDGAMRCRLCRTGTLQLAGLVESGVTSGVMERIILRCTNCEGGVFMLTTSLRLLRASELERAMWIPAEVDPFADPAAGREVVLAATG